MRYFLMLLLFPISVALQAQTNTFPPSGNVGIGTTNPISLFEVNGGPFTWKNGDHEAVLSTPSGQTGLVFNVNGLGNRTRFNFINTSSPTISNRYVSLYYNDDGLSNGLVVRKGGNIGIGTTSPTNRLTIHSSVPNTEAQMNIYNPSSINGSVSGVRFHTASGWNVMLRTNQNNAWLELVDSDGDWKHRWYGSNYYTMGSIGIGTTTPDYKLDVLGTIRANEVKVATGWSDFVFEPDYALPTLQEVESYIDQNGHLPDIPSAAEVQADGISLGEMDAKLLQKIEELTLYVIELKNRIKSLENEK
jgi:hypothetical protein